MINQDQLMFVKSSASSAVGLSRFATPVRTSGELTFSWLAIGVPSISVSHGLDYYGSYSGYLLLTDGPPVIPNIEVECPGFHGHEYSQEGICRVVDPDGNHHFIKWQCAPTPPPEGAIAACEGTAFLVGSPDETVAVSLQSDFYAVIESEHEDGSLAGRSTFGRDLFDSDAFLERQSHSDAKT